MSGPARLSPTPDVRPVRAFLETQHLALAGTFGAFAASELERRPEPADDGAARREAKEILERLGRAGWFEAIRRQDWRGCCLARESLGAASPLADAVFALQGLGTLPILLAGDERMKAEFAEPALAGRAMAAFAMTEPGAGSDVAAMATTARRDGDAYVLNGGKTLISNAGLADFYTVFASTDAAARGKGISCFVVPAGTRGLRFAGPQVLSSPHPLGEIAFEDCRVPAGNRLGEEGRGFGLG
ncbi:MAG TPA: acyl-CoA dehydrogenase family protein [Candidatus Eisenbacteria bacterium]|nr:acyl-CoA dehydrogenase family protein [Candidatus Eisenbacteria bacterium]